MNGESVLRNVSSSLEVRLFVADPSAASDVGSGWAKSGLTVRVVRGRKMRDYQGLFGEFAAAFQFPWYFGENGNAFDECIKDLSWLPPQSGYVLVITDPGQVLKRDDFLRSGDEWHSPPMNASLSVRRVEPSARDALSAMDTSYETATVYDVRRLGFGFELVPRTVSPPICRAGGQVGAELLAEAPLWTDAWLVADGDSIVGFAAVSYEPWNRRLRLWHLYVDAGHRRRGVAALLLSTVQHHAGSVGASHVFAETPNVNAPAIATYLRFGFRLVGFDASLYSGTDHADEVAVYLALAL